MQSDDDLAVQIGKRITQARLALGVSQEDLGQRAGIPQGTLSRFESGSRAPGARLLLRLALALDCSTDWLLGRHPDNHTLC